MKILFIHNRYQQKGGEDTVFEQERELLSQTEEVNSVIFQNFSGVRGAMQFFLSIWNIFSASKIKKAIRQFQPEVIHVHNWHYAIGPLVVRTANRMKIPIVLTVQNFRLLCPSATLLYKGSLFMDSIHASFPWKAIKNKVYRNSFIQTFWLAFFFWVHKKKGTWKMVDRYIVQTDLAKSVFVSSSLGVSESQFSVKPNFIKDPELMMVEREDFFLFIGRLSEEKGIQVLLEAFKNKKSELYIGGDGPLKENVIKACNENPNLHYAGLLDVAKVRNMMCRCTTLIFPSIWYEGMPMTLIEAFAAGTPVIASNLGAMASMIKNGYNGLHFNAGNSIELSEKIQYWESLAGSEKKLFSKNARSSFETLYTPEKNREQSLSIYHSVIKNKSGK
jgi:glycosyltransferase involved in cell wall biosynthesis